jgi:nucleoside-diphosphate-sugar epimerase
MCAADQKGVNLISEGKVRSVGEKTVAITGANGFIGRNLVQLLIANDDVQVRLLIRGSRSPALRSPRLTVVQGNLLAPEMPASFLVPGCTVVNLAYDSGAPRSANLLAARNLARVCSENQVKRLIHCSTAVVFGRCADDVVNEESLCAPRTEYGITKLMIEQVLREEARGHFEIVILRPTAVFGPGGQALLKLAAQLAHGSRTLNYLRSCLFSKRKMNLVCVDNVSAAIQFLAESENRMDGETFIVSQDDEPDNNFQYVEKFLLAKLAGHDYALPRLPLPPAILSWFLLMLKRDVVNPERVYDSSKLQRAGFRPIVPLGSGLAAYVEWYQEQVVSGRHATP